MFPGDLMSRCTEVGARQFRPDHGDSIDPRTNMHDTTEDKENGGGSTKQNQPTTNNAEYASSHARLATAGPSKINQSIT